jgi:hypothetical protein
VILRRKRVFATSFGATYIIIALIFQRDLRVRGPLIWAANFDNPELHSFEVRSQISLQKQMYWEKSVYWEVSFEASTDIVGIREQAKPSIALGAPGYQLYPSSFKHAYFRHSPVCRAEHGNSENRIF